ncbi:MAG: ParB/RepB/Spo0J family partition protein [Clostridia bacterium]|nr:ParB/RepB/Spo0J family partition protein [Clostridia bacterium]
MKNEVRQIPLKQIDDFPEHPFRVCTDADMAQLTQSILEHGVISPVILRQKEDGRYEIISGHRRRRACELAGLDAVPAVVRQLSRDEAILLMVDSNLQRSVILPSEKAFAYKMRLEAMKRQGQRTDLRSAPVGSKLRSRSYDELAEQVGESHTQIQRYIRLTELIPPLLQMVDEGKLPMRQAVDLSYLSREEQQTVLELMEDMGRRPSLKQSFVLKQLSREGGFDRDAAEELLSEEKPQEKRIALSMERFRKLIPIRMPQKQAEEIILKALAFYLRHLEMERLREQEYER